MQPVLPPAAARPQPARPPPALASSPPAPAPAPAAAETDTGASSASPPAPAAAPPALDTRSSSVDGAASPLTPSSGAPLASPTSPSNVVITGGAGNAPITPGGPNPSPSPSSTNGAPTEAPSAEAILAEKAAKRERIRTKVAFEIESTELSFVESLEALVKLYINPLQTLAAADDPILSTAEITTLFSNIGTICALNRKFLTDLSARLKGWDNNQTLIGDIFLGFTPFFKSQSTRGRVERVWPCVARASSRRSLGTGSHTISLCALLFCVFVSLPSQCTPNTSATTTTPVSS